MRYLAVLALVVAAGCGDDIHITAPCAKERTITADGLHADTTVRECLE